MVLENHDGRNVAESHGALVASQLVVIMKPRKREVLGIIASLLAFTGLWLWLSTDAPEIFVEHGAMENFQAICMTLGVLLFLWQMRTGELPQRITSGGLALFYATFLILEFDTRELGWRAAATVLNGAIRNGWLGALWLLLGIWVFRHRHAVVPVARQWLWSRAGLLLVLAGCFWVAGGAVDKLKLLGSTSRNLLGEELLETNAALLMLLAALAAVRSSKKPPTLSQGAESYAREAPKAQD